MGTTFFPLRLSAFPAKVPLLPNIEYDFAGLHDFPTRHGITSSDLQDLDRRPAVDSASLVQSWLFFGSLAELTGTPIDRQSIFQSSAHRPRSALRTPVHPGDSHIFEVGLHVKRSKLKTLSRKLNHILQLGIDNVGRIDRLNIANESPMPLVLLSIKILLCDLAAMQVGRSGISSLSWDGGMEEPRLLPYSSDSSFVSSAAKALEGLMTAQGWCPSQILRVGSTCDYSMMNYLSKLDRKLSEKTSHQSCSSDHCQAYNSDPDSYVTSHTVLGCQCSFIAAPTEQLNDIIRSGGVPLISLHEASHGNLAIRVHTSTAKSQYTAISHVWSGGLGNVQANSLPLCQLRYLNRCLSQLQKDGERGLNYKKNAYIRDLSGTIWISPLGLDNLVSTRHRKPKIFWMDTLCIPVDPKSSDLRMKAINKMDAVYAHAREVLVLDSEAQRLSISETHPSELLARLAYSSWMGRSWTLQEGAIGRVTYFQCADGAMTLERSRYYLIQQSPFSLVLLGVRGLLALIRQRVTKINYSESAIGQSTGHDRLENFLLKNLMNSLHRGRDNGMGGDMELIGLVPENMQLGSFVSVWNELIKRTTTKPEDMFAIFANLLDFNAGQIIKLPQDKRMKVILWSCSMIPFSLLYNTGPRLEGGESPRDRWVPTVPKGSKLAESPFMKFAHDGLSFCLRTMEDENQPLAMIAQTDSLPMYCYIVDTESDRIYFVKAIRSERDPTISITHQAICIVIEPFLDDERANLKHSAPTATRGTRGVSLFVTSETAKSATTPDSLALNQANPSETVASDTTALSTVYDCPVRIWEVNETASVPESEKGAVEDHFRLGGCPIIQCKQLKPGYEIYLETGMYEIVHMTKGTSTNNTCTTFTDTPRPDKPYARRTLPTNPSVIALNAIVVLFLLFFFSYIVPLIIFAILFAQEHGHFTLLGQIAILCYSLSFVWMFPPFALLGPVSTVLIIIDRIQRHEFNALAKAYVALAFGGLLPGTLYAVLWDVTLRDYAYKAWLATFEEDWDTNGKYRVWWWIFGVNVRLMDRVGAVEKWWDRRRQRWKSSSE